MGRYAKNTTVSSEKSRGEIERILPSSRLSKVGSTPLKKLSWETQSSRPESASLTMFYPRSTKATQRARSR